MSITTRKGDGGRTRLFSGEEVPKHHPRPSVYGDLDETVSAMGLARALCRTPRVQELLLGLQRDCFLVGSELATSGAHIDRLPRRLEATHLEAIDALGSKLEQAVKIPPEFTVPGSSPGSAALDLARTICRRLERGAAALAGHDPPAITNPALLPFLNRLSDILFLLARLEEQEQGIPYQRLRE